MRLRLGLILVLLLASLPSQLSSTAHAAGEFASAPQNVTATALELGIRVQWSAPESYNSAISGYRVEYSTSGTSGSWTTSTTTGASTYLYDISGLTRVNTYVRVAALMVGNTVVGTYGYPWTKMYGTTNPSRDANGNIIYESGYGVATGDPYNTLNGASFSRVKYRMDATLSGVSYFAETDFYNWPNVGDATQVTSRSYNASSRSVMIPGTASPYAYMVQANVSDLNIYSNNSNVNNKSGASGRIEIWPWDYTMATSGLSGVGSGGSYDWDDLPSASGTTYGSFQVHDLSASRTVFAWNDHINGGVPDIGFGPQSSGNPDWTFCTGCGTTPFRLQVWINIPTTPLLDSTAPTVSRIDAKTIIKNGDTITVRSTELGTVYLVRNSVTVSNLASITGAAANLKSSVSITTSNLSTTLTTSGLLDGIYSLYASDSSGNLSSAITNTIQLDSTAPVATNFSVSPSGNEIWVIVGETSTLATFSALAYSVSDSGSAISVTSAIASGLTITLALSRSIPAGATVAFAYDPSLVSVGSRWVDAAGNQLGAVTSRTITNNSSAPITVSLTVPEPISKGMSVTISASVSVAGKITFTIAGKRIPGCLNKSASGTTPITVSCLFKPSLTARQSIKAILTPTLAAYPITTATVERFILKRTTSR